MITSVVDSTPPELSGHVPFKIKLLRALPGPNRDDYWIGEMLAPLLWVNDGQPVKVNHVVVCTRYEGTQIVPSVRDLTIGIAFVIDPTQINSARVDFAKCKYVAIAVVNETSSMLN